MDLDVALDALKAAHRAAQDVTATINLGLEFKDEEGIQDGVDILTAIVSDTAYVLENVEPKISIGSRRGAAPDLPEERLQLLREAVAIDELTMENLLKTRMDISVDQEQILLDQFYRLLKALKLRVETTRRILKENWPGFWGEELDLEFSRYLKRPKKK